MVQFVLLDSLLEAGYGYSREQAPGSVLDKAMRIPVQAEGGVGFKISTAMSIARRRGL